MVEDKQGELSGLAVLGRHFDLARMRGVFKDAHLSQALSPVLSRISQVPPYVHK